MGAEQSKLLYEQVDRGDVEGIKALIRDGAHLEWTDEEWKTPLILACTRGDLLDVAKVLIELGANVDAYAFGSAGTALHHAAERGLDQHVELLLSSGADHLEFNHSHQTPLEIAQSKGHCKVVRAIEEHTCLFHGWMRILDGPSIIEAFAPQWVHRKIWAVVLHRNSPRLLDLVIYPNKQAAQYEKMIFLWKADVVPKFNLLDPAVIIIDKVSGAQYKFLSSKQGDKQQLQRFLDACEGHSQTPTKQWTWNQEEKLKNKKSD